MELREFITVVFEEVFGGIIDARTSLKDAGGRIAPINQRYECDKGLTVRDVDARVSVIDFEVVLTESQNEAKTNRKGVGVFLSRVGIGVDNTNERGGHSAAQTSVKFSIPGIYPE